MKQNNYTELSGHSFLETFDKMTPQTPQTPKLFFPGICRIFCRNFIEVQQGICAMVVQGDGEVIRLVAVSALRITDSSDRILVQIGRLRDGVVVLVMLPCHSNRNENQNTMASQVIDHLL